LAGLFLGVFSTFLSTFFLAVEFLARLDGYFATRSLAGDWPIELTLTKVLAGVGNEVELSGPWRSRLAR
jgi:hypothetical protein